MVIAALFITGAYVWGHFFWFFVYLAGNELCPAIYSKYLGFQPMHKSPYFPHKLVYWTTFVPIFLYALINDRFRQALYEPFCESAGFFQF
jgi:hypothetical protein